MTTAKMPEIFYEEMTQDNIPRCPYCGTGNVNEVSFCYTCKKTYRLQQKTIFIVAKDCKLNNEEHDFKQIPDDFNPIVREICTKCEAQRCKQIG